MLTSPPPQADADDLEQLAAEFLAEQGEVVNHDNHDRLDQFSDAALADALVTAQARRLGKLDFGRLRQDNEW